MNKSSDENIWVWNVPSKNQEFLDQDSTGNCYTNGGTGKGEPMHSTQI